MVRRIAAESAEIPLRARCGATPAANGSDSRRLVSAQRAHGRLRRRVHAAQAVADTAHARCTASEISVAPVRPAGRHGHCRRVRTLVPVRGDSGPLRGSGLSARDGAGQRFRRTLHVSERRPDHSRRSDRYSRQNPPGREPRRRLASRRVGIHQGKRTLWIRPMRRSAGSKNSTAQSAGHPSKARCICGGGACCTGQDCSTGR